MSSDLYISRCHVSFQITPGRAQVESRPSVNNAHQSLRKRYKKSTTFFAGPCPDTAVGFSDASLLGVSINLIPPRSRIHAMRKVLITIAFLGLFQVCRRRRRLRHHQPRRWPLLLGGCCRVGLPAKMYSPFALCKSGVVRNSFSFFIFLSVSSGDSCWPTEVIGIFVEVVSSYF